MAGGMKKRLTCSQLPVTLTHPMADLPGETQLILARGFGGFCLWWLGSFALVYVTRPCILSGSVWQFKASFLTFQRMRDDGELGEEVDSGFSVE